MPRTVPLFLARTSVATPPRRPSTSGLRSDAWLGGDDEVALNHRAALRAAGLRRSAGSRRSRGRPLIGIACTASDLNRCDLGLTALAEAVRRGVRAAGGLPLRFPVMSLSEDLIKPTAMLYRNLLAIEVEETIRSQPLDGIVALGNCDKTVPAYLMALASADIPALIVTGGFRVPATFDGEPLGQRDGAVAAVRRAARRPARFRGVGAAGDLPRAGARTPATRWAPPRPWRSWPRRWAWRCRGRRCSRRETRGSRSSRKRPGGGSSRWSRTGCGRRRF